MDAVIIDCYFSACVDVVVKRRLLHGVLIGGGYIYSLLFYFEGGGRCPVYFFCGYLWLEFSLAGRCRNSIIMRHTILFVAIRMSATPSRYKYYSTRVYVALRKCAFKI